MPVDYSIENEILRLDLVGLYTPDDVIQKFEEAFANPDLPPKAHLLVDVSKSETLRTRSKEEIQKFVGHFMQMTESYGQKRAIVTRSPVQYGLMRMAAAMSESRQLEVRVFRDDVEAFRWLKGEIPDLDEPVEAPVAED